MKCSAHQIQNSCENNPKSALFSEKEETLKKMPESLECNVLEGLFLWLLLTVLAF